MKKLLYIGVASLAFTSCDDYFYADKLTDKDPNTFSNVVIADYELTAADYTSIANNQANKDLAAQKDNEAGTEIYAKALEEMGKNKKFNANCQAEDYLPAFVAATWPEADLGSKFNIYYDQERETPKYMEELSNISTYTLTESDYAEIWGKNMTASFVSPLSEGKVAKVLKNAFPAAVTGDVAVVNYAYSETEPSKGPQSEASATNWTRLAISNAPDGSNWNYVNTGAIDLSNYAGKKVRVAFRYTSSSSVAPTVEVKNLHIAEPFKADYSSPIYVFAQKEDGTFAKATSVAAGKYVIAALVGDEYIPFGRVADDAKNYGYFVGSAIAVTDGVIAAADAADWTLTVAATDNGYSIMADKTANYIYMKGTYNSFNLDAEKPAEGADWTFSFNADGSANITNVLMGKVCKYDTAHTSYGSYPETVYMNNSLLSDALADGFDMVDVNLGALSYVWSCTAKYGFKASAYANNVNNEAESWIVTSEIDLESATAPYIAFDYAARYFSPDALADHFGVYVSEDYAEGNDFKIDGNKSLKADEAAVEANKSALYTFNGTAWALYTTSDAKVTVVEPAAYKTSAKLSVAQVCAYMSITYPLAAEGDTYAVVYNSDKGIKAVELMVAEGAWTEIKGIKNKTTLSKDTEGITAKISVFIDAPLTGGDDGGFKAQDIKLTGDLTYVWTITSSYGWKASAFKKPNNLESESWLVTPSMDFRKAVKPVLSFESAINFYTIGDVTEIFGVYISNDYAGDVTTATWTCLNDKVSAWGDGGSYTYVPSGDVDLSEFVGKYAVIAFKYNSTNEAAATVELMNVKVREAE